MLTADDSKILLDSLQISWDELEEAYTRVRYTLRENGEDITLWVEDTSAINSLGLRETEIDLRCYQDRNAAQWVAQFWLNQWKRIHKRAAIVTPLFLLEAEVLDGITVNRTNYVNGVGRVEGLRHLPGNGRDEQPDRIALDVTLAQWAGCTTTCESACQTGCEDTCEVWCQTGCEISCEQACQLTLQAVCNFACQTVHELACGLGCQANCQVGCEVMDVVGGTVIPLSLEGGSCATNEQAACSICCQDTCELSCQTTCAGHSCETTCMTGCETYCTTGCEQSCQSALENCAGACTTSCEVNCETPTCETSCEYGCTLSNEGITLPCCEFGCTVDCASTTCTTSCQTSCESNCEQTCEASGCENEEVCDVCCMVSCTWKNET